MTAPKEQRLLLPLHGYATDVGVWLSALQDARARTLRVLEKVEPQWIDFVPEGEGESIGTILYHLAAIETSWLYEDVLQIPFPPDVEALLPYDVRDANGTLTSVSASLQEHLNRLGRIRERLLQEFSKMTAEDFWRIMRSTDYDVSPAYVVHHLMQHEAEHRSQIDAIRRKAKIVMSDRLPEENS
jgi:uncharacterized damage-inducible protein DinB